MPMPAGDDLSDKDAAGLMSEEVLADNFTLEYLPPCVACVRDYISITRQVITPSWFLL